MCGTKLARVAQFSGDLNPSVFTLAVTRCHPSQGEVCVVDALKICKGHLTQGLACMERAIVLSFWAQASP